LDQGSGTFALERVKHGFAEEFDLPYHYRMILNGR
jgi:hypothetical protein